MAILKILHYPDERLHRVAAPVEHVDDGVRKLVADMAETMYAAPGIGLAATQVDVHRQVVVIDISEASNNLLTFINPEILESAGRAEHEEGCLSIPGIFDKVERAAWVKVRALGADGKPFELETDGLLAVCVQHEIDHLKGKLFIEYLSRLKQNRILAKFKKMQKAVL